MIGECDFLLGCTGAEGEVRLQPEANDIIAQNPGFMFAVLLVLVPLAIGYEWYRRAKRPKTLDYDVLISTSMVAHEADSLREGLAVLWKGEQVSEPKLIKILIQNTGKEAIQRTDFGTPITVSLSGGKVLEANVVHSSPDEAVNSQDIVVSADGTKVEVTPEFLNAKERFTLQLIVDGFSAWPKVRSRFLGQDRAMSRQTLSMPADIASTRFDLILWAMGLVFVLVLFFMPTLPGPDGDRPAVAVVLLRALLAGLAAMGAGMLGMGVASAIREIRFGRRSSRNSRASVA